MRNKKIIIGTLLICASITLTGCGKPSEATVMNSDYYRKLEKEKEGISEELKSSKKKVKSLEKKINDIHQTTGDQKLSKYKAKVNDSSIVKVDFISKEVKGQNFAVTNPAVCKYAKDIVAGCYRMIGVNPSKLEDEYDEVYSYVLIDEDNTSYEFKVYGDSFIIFDDIPANVYAYNGASILGEGLVNAKTQKKYTSFVERVADAQIIVDDDSLKDNKTAIKISRMLTKIVDDVVENPKYDNDNTLWKEYRFYTYGIITTVKYSESQKAICIVDDKDEETYYEVSDKNLNRIKKYLK